MKKILITEFMEKESVDLLASKIERENNWFAWFWYYWKESL